jgi:hypothetical protein
VTLVRRVLRAFDYEGIERIARPAKQGMELTDTSVTPFAKAKAAPLLSADHA